MLLCNSFPRIRGSFGVGRTYQQANVMTASLLRKPTFTGRKTVLLNQRSSRSEVFSHVDRPKLSRMSGSFHRSSSSFDVSASKSHAGWFRCSQSSRSFPPAAPLSAAARSPSERKRPGPSPSSFTSVPSFMDDFIYKHDPVRSLSRCGCFRGKEIALEVVPCLPCGLPGEVSE